jgi:hypothetical protein
MSAAISPLELCTPKKPIPACSPNLMPFHISYTGPAPVSTYFRVKQAAEPDYGATGSTSAAPSSEPVLLTSPGDSLPLEASDSQSTLVDSQMQPDSQITLAPTQDVHMGSTLSDHRSKDVTDLGSNHLVSAFRGRTVRGLKVDLPAGYTGLVLNIADSSTSALRQPNGSEKAQVNTRPLRNAKRAAKQEEPDMTELADALQEEETKEYSGPVRTMQATGTFDSFVLWNPDIPVDEGKDEYLRSLTEWTKLAAVVSKAAV